MSKEIIAHSRLLELLDYNPATGVFVWKKANKYTQYRIGKIAGCVGFKGYRDITIDGRACKAHHLAWLFIYGCWPSDQLDHENRNRDDNSIDNLREADSGINARNKKLQHNNKSGVSGVCWNSLQGWGCQINYEGKRFYHRYHKDFHKAVAIRKALEVMLDYHPNHGKSIT